MTTVYCSGLLSGPQPSPGLGVARSLRAAFPDLHLVGVDYSMRSTGLHHPVFDELWIQRPWAELSLDSYASSILQRLDAGASWICGSEREARWLAGAAGTHDGLLGPSLSALERIDVPADLAPRLGLLCPPAISTREEDWQLNAFGRQHGWRLWLRGPCHAPVRIEGWRSLERARADLAGAWSTAGLRLQAHVQGTGEPIVFAAHRGGVLGMRHLRAAITTTDGTTWGGCVTDLTDALPDVASQLERQLAEAAWTGGGEIEIVRSIDGALWLIECRPHFATWVHGAALAGANLPAALIAAATGRPPLLTEDGVAEFVRVVVEIPSRAGISLPEAISAVSGVVRAGNYLSGMPDPTRRRSGDGGAHPRELAVQPPETLKAIVADLRCVESTPYAHRIDPAPRWESLAAQVDAAAGACRVQVAYSIKTDPDRDLLIGARSHGFMAEAITAAEMRRAQDVGFTGDEIILNGPAKRWPLRAAPIRTFAAFADSLDELASLATLARSGALSTRYLGPRLRPPSVASRFGVQLGDFNTFSGVVTALQSLPSDQSVGLQFHWSSSEAGHDTWFDTVAATLEWGRCLQDLVGRAIRCLDLGGGWHPDDFDSVLLPRLPTLVGQCVAELDALEVIVLEPGRALVQPLSVVETTVLEVRESDDARELVVDASLAEVPRAGVYPHRILSHAGDGWRHWGRGPDRVLGRLCMEDDVLRAGVAVPDEMRAGARILIADAGAYDRSMAYRFGRG